jgi:hypothetical protein
LTIDGQKVEIVVTYTVCREAFPGANGLLDIKHSGRTFTLGMQKG